jgi:hypothetical protein
MAERGKLVCAMHHMRVAKGSPMPQSQPVLPANRAFVVQFRTPPTGALGSYEGRVEHLVSGQEARFHSLEELLAFMLRILTTVQEQTGAG